MFNFNDFIPPITESVITTIIVINFKFHTIYILYFIPSNIIRNKCHTEKYKQNKEDNKLQ